MPSKQQMIAIAVAGGLIYVAASGKIKNPAVNTAMIAIGSIAIANKLPFIGQYV